MISKMILISTILPLLLVTLLGNLQAQNDNAYDLDTLIEIGLRQSTNIKSEELSRKNAQSSLVSSYLNFLPSASVDVGHVYPDDRQSASFNLSKSLSLNEPSYFNWRRANIDMKNAQLSYEENRRETVYEVFSRFIRVVEAERRLEIQRKNLDIQRRILEQTELLYELAQRSLIEMKQAEISLINAQIGAEDAEIQLTNLRENLFLYLNLEDEGYPLSAINIPLLEEVPDYDKPVQVVQAENELDKTSLSLTQSRLEFLPNLSLSYRYSHSYSGNDNVFDFDDYNDSYTISLSASYTLFKLVEHRQYHHRNRRNFQNQKLLFDDLKDLKQQQFRQMIREWEREKRLYELAERRSELAVETLELAQNRFNLGILSLLELDQATKDFLEASVEESSRYYQRLLKQEELNLFLAEPILGKW